MERWTKLRVQGATRWRRVDGLVVYRPQGGINPEWYFKTRTGKLSYGPFASSSQAIANADRKFRRVV